MSRQSRVRVFKPCELRHVMEIDAEDFLLDLNFDFSRGVVDSRAPPNFDLFDDVSLVAVCVARSCYREEFVTLFFMTMNSITPSLMSVPRGVTLNL